jgi:hypothetical protein
MACCDFDRLRALVCAGMEKVSVRWLVRKLWRCTRGRGRSVSRARADTTVTERVRTASSAATAANSLLPPRPCWCNLVADTHCDCSLVEATSLSLLTFLFRPLLPTRYQALPLLPPRRNQHTHSRSPPPRRTHPPPLRKDIQSPRAASRNPPPWPTCSTPSPSSSSPSAQVRTHTPVPSNPSPHPSSPDISSLLTLDTRSTLPHPRPLAPPPPTHHPRTPLHAPAHLVPRRRRGRPALVRFRPDRQSCGGRFEAGPGRRGEEGGAAHHEAEECRVR